MRRLHLIIIYICLTLVVGRVHAQYYSVNYDKQTVAAMAAAFGAGAMAESYYGIPQEYDYIYLNKLDDDMLETIINFKHFINN